VKPKKVKEHEQAIAKKEIERGIPARVIVWADEWTSEKQCAWCNFETVEEYRARLKRKGIG